MARDRGQQPESSENPQERSILAAAAPALLAQAQALAAPVEVATVEIEAQLELLERQIWAEVAAERVRLARWVVRVALESLCSATPDKEDYMGPRTFALIENGVVVNIISMYAKNLTDFPNAILAVDRPVSIGDSYIDGVFLRDGVPLLSYEELAATAPQEDTPTG